MNKAYRPLLVAACLTALGYGAPTLAQEGAEPVEEIVITGSRIRQNPLEVRTPVQTFSEEDMNRTSSVALSDFLQELPISGSAINRLNNSSGNLGFPPDGTGIGAGAAEVDLRNLGSKRTLVLVDGRRWVRGSSASGVSGSVDLNSIPYNSVKSIEVLQDGASAVYGTDAIGGVVNIITQDNYDGLQISGYYGAYEDSDGETSELTKGTCAAGAANWGDDDRDSCLGQTSGQVIKKNDLDPFRTKKLIIHRKPTGDKAEVIKLISRLERLLE